MIDTSVWVDHLRGRDEVVVSLLNTGLVLAHPFVIGELALGHLRQRRIILDALQNLPRAIVATDPEVIGFIDDHDLAGMGIGYIDAHLLASTRLTTGSSLLTRDRRLSGIAERLGIAAK